MKINKGRIYVVFLTICVLILLTFSRVQRNKRKAMKITNHKTITRKTLNKIRQEGAKDHTEIAKKKCTENCEKSYYEVLNNPIHKTNPPTKSHHHLYLKKTNGMERFLCKCKISADSQHILTDYYFSNKDNIDDWVKNDDDGHQVYSNITKNLEKSEYKLIFKN